MYNVYTIVVYANKLRFLTGHGEIHVYLVLFTSPIPRVLLQLIVKQVLKSVEETGNRKCVVYRS
jgi:hypothetical protein